MSRTLRDISKEAFSKGYIARARQRAQRRKSAWNLILIPLGFGGIAGTTYVLFRIMWQVHVAIYPAHAGRLSEFWGQDISFGSFFSSFLLLIPLFFAAIPVGLILTNMIAWLIPPARRTFAREAEGVVGASFADATSELAKIALIIVPICLAISSVGAATLRDLQ